MQFLVLQILWLLFKATEQLLGFKSSSCSQATNRILALTSPTGMRRLAENELAITWKASASQL